MIFLFWIDSARIQNNERHLSFSDFMDQLERGHVAKVTITGTGVGSQIGGEFKNGQAFRTFAPPETENLIDTLLSKGVVVNARDANRSSWVGHIISWTPIVIMIGFLIFFMRQMQSSGDEGLTRAERRVHNKAQVHRVLSESEEGLSEKELSSRLSEVCDEAALHRALYEMLSEGTILLTTRRKYRVKTVD